jgi:GNAT superfamily N-acetyltransferase
VIEVRVATLGDRAAVARLRRTWTEESVGHPVDDPTFEERFEAWFARELDQRVTWLAYDAAEAVGMLNLLVFTRMPFPREPDSERPTQWGYLANCFVLADHRNRGAGDALVAACTAYADEHGFARIVLSPSERSIPFYARSDFVPATSLMVRPGPRTS